jgi:hypothetical protein
MRVSLGRVGFCVALLISLSIVRADTLILTSVAPGEIVHANGSGLAPPVNTDLLSGVLNWTDQSTTPNTSFQTFCIDVNHDINFNTPYDFTIGGAVNSSSNGGDALLTPTIVAEIYALWNLHGSSDLSLYTNDQANSFQTALWDILYNGGSATGTGPLAISSTDPTVELHIKTGFLWAADAVANHSDPILGSGNYLNTMIFTSATGQEQIYIGNPSGAPVPTPLPSALGGGLLLLGLLGAFNWRRKAAC